MKSSLYHHLLFKESFLLKNIEIYFIRKCYYYFKSEYSLLYVFVSKIWGSLCFPCLLYLKIYVYLLMRDLRLNSNFTTNDERYCFLFVVIAL